MDLTSSFVHITHANDVKNVKSTTWCKTVILQTMYNQNYMISIYSPITSISDATYLNN